MYIPSFEILSSIFTHSLHHYIIVSYHQVDFQQSKEELVQIHKCISYAITRKVPLWAGKQVIQLPNLILC